MKKLSDFKGAAAMAVATKLTRVIMAILADERNRAIKEGAANWELFTSLAENNPDEMTEILAIMNEKTVEEYEHECDGNKVMTDLLSLASDPLIIGLFISRGQKGDATSSVSRSENTEE